MNFSRKNIANSVRFAIILLISATISVSCTKEIDGDLPSVETQLVVDANIETNTPPIFILTKTSPVFGGFDLDDLGAFFEHNAVIWVKNKTTNDSVQLMEFCLNDLPFDDSTKADLLKGLGFIAQDSSEELPNVCIYTVPDIVTYYTTGTCSFYGQEQHEYSMTIRTEKYYATGETSIPQSIPPETLVYTPNPKPEYDTLVTVKVRVNVPSDIGHFVRYWTKRNSEPFYPPLSQSVWDDKLFAGLNIDLPIERGQPSNASSRDDSYGYFWKGDTVTVKWANIDYKTYNFFITLENDGTGSPFSPQVKVQSNVTGAIGVFAGYATSYKTIIIPE